MSNSMKGSNLKEERDRELVIRALDGDAGAFRDLIEKHTALVYSVVGGILKRDADIDDTVQEVFIKVYRNLSSYRGDSRFSTWLYRIARNESINALQRSRDRLVPIEEAERLPAQGGNPEEHFARKRLAHDMRGLLSKLDEQYRVVLELRYMGDKSYSEIAEIMEIPVGTVKTNIHRAKAELKRMIESAGARRWNKAT